jgi:hypothetical protein
VEVTPLNFVLSNCSWEDGVVCATFRQPFDLLAETAAITADQEAVNAANSAKSENWLGNLQPKQASNALLRLQKCRNNWNYTPLCTPHETPLGLLHPLR